MTERVASKRRNAANPNRHGTKPSAKDKFELWLSTSRTIDGLWVGSCARDRKNEREITLRRVEEALRLIKLYDPLSYSRIIRDLKRIWVNLVPHYNAWYLHPLQACVLDGRYVLSETTTLEQIALTIIHEATHARLERCGIDYDEKLRQRIEAVCLRREFAFVAKLPNGAKLRDELARTLEWSTANRITTRISASASAGLKVKRERFVILGRPSGLFTRY
jgi:hypothetical protein